MLYREIIVVCFEIHTKYVNKLCGQNVELLNVKLVVHIVTTGLYRFNLSASLDRTAKFQLLKTLTFSDIVHMMSIKGVIFL